MRTLAAIEGYFNFPELRGQLQGPGSGVGRSAGSGFTGSSRSLVSSPPLLITPRDASFWTALVGEEVTVSVKVTPGAVDRAVLWVRSAMHGNINRGYRTCELGGT